MNQTNNQPSIETLRSAGVRTGFDDGGAYAMGPLRWEAPACVWTRMDQAVPKLQDGAAKPFLIVVRGVNHEPLVREAWYLQRHVLRPDEYLEPEHKPEQGQEWDEETEEMRWTGWCWLLGDLDEEKFYRIRLQVLAWAPLPLTPAEFQIGHGKGGVA